MRAPLTPWSLPLLAAVLSCGTVALAGQADSDTTSMQSYLGMKEASDAFRGTAVEFITSAAAGDTAHAADLISPNMAQKTGRAAIHQFLSATVAPFFADMKEIGKSVTISNTTDGFGSEGYAYYMYAVPKEGEPRPFVVYVVAEGDTTVVANILVDHFVEGRHQ